MRGMGAQYIEVSQKFAQAMDAFEAYQNSYSEEARDYLVAKYYSLVEFLARKFDGRGEPLDDLIQVGLIGLLKAIERYEPDRGVKFETYATPTIVGEIKRYFRDRSWNLKVPRGVKDLSLRIQQAKTEFVSENGRNPNREELAEVLRVSPEKVDEANQVVTNRFPLSLDGTLNGDSEEDSGSFYFYLGQDDHSFDYVLDSLTLKEAFQELDDRDKQILFLRYFEELSQQQVGERLDLSQMHVSRLERRALNKLRQITSGEDASHPMPGSGRLKAVAH